MSETQVQPLGLEDLLEKEIAAHSSILAWKILWTEKPGGLQSTGSQRVRHDLLTKQQQRFKKSQEYLWSCLIMGKASSASKGFISFI